MELLHQTLTERFQQYFKVEFAGSSEQKNAVYDIRYRVYCEDFAYEPARLFPDKLERDEFDERSLHALITHRSSGKHAGCVRLVGTGDGDGRDLLPFEKHCPGSVAREFYSERNLRRENLCEISRLAVDRMFRQRTGERGTLLGEPHAIDFSQSEKRSFSLIAIAGFLAATALTDISGRTAVFAMMEPFLPRLFKRAGVEFQRAGQELAYHGTRAPYFIKTEWAVENMRPELRQLYNTVHRQVDRSYRAYHADLLAKSYKALS